MHRLASFIVRNWKGFLLFRFYFNKRLENEAAGKQEAVSIGSFAETKNIYISVLSISRLHLATAAF